MQKMVVAKIIGYLVTSAIEGGHTEKNVAKNLFIPLEKLQAFRQGKEAPRLDHLLDLADLAGVQIIFSGPAGWLEIKPHLVI